MPCFEEHKFSIWAGTDKKLTPRSFSTASTFLVFSLLWMPWLKSLSHKDKLRNMGAGRKCSICQISKLVGSHNPKSV